MAKQKKKRDKQYRGAAQRQSSVTRIQAVERGRIGGWLHEHQQLAGLIKRGLVIALFVALIIAGFMSLG